MNSILFTYYSDQVKDIFLDNIQSFLANCDHEYSSLAICSQSEIPLSIKKSLGDKIRITRVYPDANSRMARKNTQGRPTTVDPYLLTALSFSSSCDVITVLDSQLFIINTVSSYSGNNIFYCDHKGRINPALFTFRRNNSATSLLITALSQTDFSDPIIISRFAFLVSNGTAFEPRTIIQDQFILSNPSTDLKLHHEKLIAIDLSNTFTDAELHKEMWNYRKSQIGSDGPISKFIKSSISNLTKSISKLVKPEKDSIILFKYASRSRPDLFYRGLVSIFNNVATSNFVVLVTLDENDPSIESYRSLVSEFPESQLKVIYGTSKNKIDAINRDLLDFSENWDILINMSDDMVFIEYGFDNIIRKGFEDNFPNGDGFLHFHDNCQNRLATMSIMDKLYFNRFGYIYHPDYVSVYCDNEAQEVSQILGKYKYMGDSIRILDHLHPLHNPTIQMDAQYVHTESFYDQDRSTYNRRKNINFEL